VLQGDFLLRSVQVSPSTCLINPKEFVNLCGAVIEHFVFEKAFSL
jgi:hypothetical protein